MSEKINIKNREDKRIVVLFDEIENAKGIAFVMHGLGGCKEQPHIATFAKAFNDKGISTIRFDVTHSYGESEGEYEDATVTNYYEDLEDVIEWAKSQNWYKEPFFLAGHSLGGISTTLYSEKYPEKVKGLAPISTVVSGKLLLEAPSSKDWLKWKKEGWKISESSSKPGFFKKIKWDHFEDVLEYDILDNVGKLIMPVLLIVGSEDKTTPSEHQKIFYDKISSKKEFHIIKGSRHTFNGKEYLKEIKDIFEKWIDSI